MIRRSRLTFLGCAEGTVRTTVRLLSAVHASVSSECVLVRRREITLSTFVHRRWQFLLDDVSRRESTCGVVYQRGRGVGEEIFGRRGLAAPLEGRAASRQSHTSNRSLSPIGRHLKRVVGWLRGKRGVGLDLIYKKRSTTRGRKKEARSPRDRARGGSPEVQTRAHERARGR